MTDYGKLFYDEITNWLIDVTVFKQSQCQMYIYYKYATYGYKLVVLSYVDYCLYWYTGQESGFVYTWKEVTCELPRICTSYYVYQDLTTKVLLNISVPS